MPIDPTSDMQQHIERYCPQCDSFHAPAVNCADVTLTCASCGAQIRRIDCNSVLKDGALITPVCDGCAIKLDEKFLPPAGGS